jgi:hypothetical protein
MLGKQLFDELARQFVARSAPRNSGPTSAKAPSTLSDPPNERTRALEPNVGTLLYLISLGVVAIATVVVFFGLGFLLLAHPNEETIAGTHARDRGAEVEPQRADLVPSPDKDAAPSITQTASALSVSPAPPEPHYDVLQPASEGRAPSSAIARDPGVANPTPDASSNRELWGLRSNADDAALATPSAVPRAKRAGIGRHRHSGARQHWAGVSRAGTNDRPPPPLSGPEKAWRWIVQSATGIRYRRRPAPRSWPGGSAGGTGASGRLARARPASRLAVGGGHRQNACLRTATSSPRLPRAGV